MTSELLTVILIDDEGLVLEGLTHSISWEEAGFEMPICFNDTDEALSYILQNGTDLVITDVRMPGKDGIELLKVFSDENLAIETIIMSGYRDFNYVQKAMQLGALNYLVKPIFEEELLAVLDVVKSKLRKKAEEKLYHQLYFDEGLLLFFKEDTALISKQVVEDYVLQFEAHEYIMVSIMSWKESFDKEAIYTYFESDKGKLLRPLLLDQDHKSIFIVESNKSKSYYEQCLEEYFECYYDVYVCYKGIGDARSHYKKILDQMLLCHHYKRNRKILTDPILSGENSEGYYLEALVETLNKSDPQRLDELIKEIIVLYTAGCEDHRKIYQKVINLYSYVLSAVTKLINDEDEVKRYYDISLSIDEATAEGILSFMRRRFFIVLDMLRETKQIQRAGFKKRIEIYIEDNIDKVITIKELADYVHMHPTYLGQKLSKLWEESFSTHVHRLKIQKSIEMLKTKKYLHIEDVAHQLGYQSYQSYLKYFKTFMNTTPKKYINMTE